MADENCAVCGGTGWKIVRRAGLEGADRCECATVTRSRGLVTNANIPSNYRNATLDNFTVGDNPLHKKTLSDALRAVRGFAREFPTTAQPGLLLVGDTGAGKTHLAVGAMKALMERGFECLFFDYQNLLDRIRSGYDSSSGTSDREAYRSALDCEILVLDDLGAHRVTDWVEDTVTAIITYRCNHRKPLIATTNLSDEERMSEFAKGGGDRVTIRNRTLAEMIGIRARSRLSEMCRIVRIQAVEDFRIKHQR